MQVRRIFRPSGPSYQSSFCCASEHLSFRACMPVLVSSLSYSPSLVPLVILTSSCQLARNP